MIPSLLVPGLNCTARIYRDLVPRLWPYGPVTIANHLPGATIREIAARILFDAPPGFALFGFSMGGYLALEILRQAPDRVLRLALIDTSARPDSAEQTAKRFMAIAKTEQGEFETVVRANFSLVVDTANLNDPALRDLHWSMARAVGPETYVRHQKAIVSRADSRPLLSSIAVPTLVLVGASDQVTPPETAQEMAAGIDGARLVTIEGAGHMTLAEQPEAVGQAVAGWMDEFA